MDHKNHKSYNQIGNGSHSQHSQEKKENGGEHKGHQDHHQHMIAEYKKKFWISLVFTVPILILSPMIQKFLGLAEVISFTGDKYVLFALATFIFFYGGYPFLKGFKEEVKIKSPGMMTLIAVAITTAYLYSSAVVFGLE